MDSEDMRVALVHFPPLLRSNSRSVASVFLFFLGQQSKPLVIMNCAGFPSSLRSYANSLQQTADSRHRRRQLPSGIP